MGWAEVCGQKRNEQHLSVEDEGIKNKVSAIQALTDSAHIFKCKSLSSALLLKNKMHRENVTMNKGYVLIRTN